MGLHEIKQRIAVVRDRCKPGGFECRSLTEAIEMLEGLEEVDEPPVSVDDGFAILSMPRYEALREAEEHLQETRFAPSDGGHDDKQATIDALTRENGRLKAVMSSWEVFARLKGDEIARLKADLSGAEARCRDQANNLHYFSDKGDVLRETIGRLEAENRRLKKAEAAAPLDPEAPRVADEVLLKHIQDHQAEIEGIKDRTDRTDMTATRTYNDIYNRLDHADKAVDEKLCRLDDRINAVAARLDAAGPAVGDSIGAIFDRMGALTARMNKIDAREVAKT